MENHETKCGIFLDFVAPHSCTQPTTFTAQLGLRQAIDEKSSSIEDLSATLFSWCVCKFRAMGAQYGYLKPSFADKGAVDEADKIELQVLCLTGEAVTLTMSRSMLGYDLRRLVSKNLSCKAGAKLVVHSVNRKLTLDENLEDQGIVAKTALLSCTYIPTNVYTAWRYACELPTCEREFALEGVTHLEGLTHGEYLQHLPCSLAKLTFGEDFNQSLEQVTLPSCLKSLSFGRNFDQSLERVTLPSTLQSLSFGFHFNQSLERVTLPPTLQSLSFGDLFNESLEQVTLPSSLQSLSFGHSFNQSLEQVTLPWSLESFSAVLLRSRVTVSCGGCVLFA